MTTTTPAARPATPSILRRTSIAVVLMAVMLVPAIILMALTKQPSATYAAMGAIIGAVAVTAGGLRIGVLTTLVVALLAPLSIVAGLSPLTGAALMALMTLFVGRMARFGLHRAVMLVPIFLTWLILSPVPWVDHADLDAVTALVKKGDSISDALSTLHPATSTGAPAESVHTQMTDAMVRMRLDQTYLAWVAVFFLVGSLVAVGAVALLTRRSPRPAHAATARPLSESLGYTITITVLTTVATYWFLDHPKELGGSFLIATILVLAQVGNDVQWKLTLQRVLGTAAGVVLLSGVMAVVGGTSYIEVFGIPFPATLYGIGLLFGVASIIARFGPRQWIYYVLITPCAALLNAYTTSQVAHLGTARLVDNLAGSALVVAAALITLGASRIWRHHHPDEVSATATVADA